MLIPPLSPSLSPRTFSTEACTSAPTQTSLATAYVYRHFLSVAAQQNDLCVCFYRFMSRTSSALTTQTCTCSLLIPICSFHSAALASASVWGLTSMTMFRASARTRALSVLFTGQSHGFLVLSLPLAHFCSSQRRGMRWSCHWRHRLPWYVAGHHQQRRLSYLYRFLLIGIDNLADYNNNDAMSSFSCT